MKKIFFVGLGKLGLSLATLISKKNYVLGYDYNSNHISKLKNKNYKNLENDLKHEISTKNHHIDFTDNLLDLNDNKFDFVYILIPTNQSISGNYDSKNLINLINKIINSNLRRQKLNIVICSTLQPGTFEKRLKKLKNKFNLNIIYCPEFVALGNTINGFTKPDILLIGGDNERLIFEVTKIHKTFSKPNNISTMSFQGAEIVKLAVNSYVCTKISYANLISQICNNRYINESSKIVDTIGFDSRIGNKFFKSGPPFGGLCFPKDVEAFYNLCKSSNVNSQMIKNIQSINIDQKNLFIRKLRKFIDTYKIKKLGVIGLSFKEDTMTINKSQYVEVLKKFKKIKYQIYDLNPDIENVINSTYIKSINNIIKENKYLLVNHKNKKFISKIDNSSPKTIFSPWFIDFNKKHKFHSL